MSETEKWAELTYAFHVLIDHYDRTCAELVCWFGPHHDEAVHYDGRAAHIAAIRQMLDTAASRTGTQEEE